MKRDGIYKVSALLLLCVTAAWIVTGAAARPAGTHAKKQLVIATLVQPLQNPWVVNNIRFQKAVAKALGIKLVVYTDQNTSDSNVAAMRNILATNPDGILFDPIDQAAGLADARLIERAKIPAATEDRLVVNNISEYKGKYLAAQVTQNNLRWGRDTMLSLINQGADKIVTVFPPHGVLTVEQLWTGALGILKTHPNVKVVDQNWGQQSQENGFAVMQQYLAKYKPGEINGVFGLGSTMAFGAIQAIQKAGMLGQIKVATADDDPSVISALKSGELQSTLGTHWTNGAWGLITLYDYLNGKKPLIRQPEFTLFKIDKGNADAYSARFLKQSPLTPAEIRKLSRVYNPKANLPWFISHFASTWNTATRGLTREAVG
jgi:ABC-type sugar transport system substrate-binding protein